MNGIIVHAKKGERSHYQPICSSLTKSSKPLDIVKAFMAIYPFKILYIADLNAIQEIENAGDCHINTIHRIKDEFPDLTLWVDAGINNEEKAKAWSACNAQAVLGSESFQTIEQYQTIVHQLKQPFILSLDFSPQGYLGPNALMQDTNHWPKDIIVMTLAKVGTNTGVDLLTLQRTFTKKNNHAIYAAGGVRDLNDLLQLKKLGLQGALLASALHHQQISTVDLQMLNV
jgi:phosphoribosylformimino-5-aminoimidazole carboxamide ribotide isomerase